MSLNDHRSKISSLPVEAIPPIDIGPIYVVGFGPYEWSTTAGKYVASTGATGGAPNNRVFYLNHQVVTSDFEVPTGHNALSAGPIGIADGVTVTIAPGSTWSIT